jgi:glucokinase
VKDRRVHHGANLHGGEFGYIVLDIIDGVPKTLSKLGATGCLVKKIAARKGMDEKLLDGIKVFDLAAAGDIVCLAEIDKFYYYLALGMYNIQYTFDPELIILGGAISERADILERLNEKMSEILKDIPDAKVTPKISKCAFLNDANLIGALYHCLVCRAELPKEN